MQAQMNMMCATAVRELTAGQDAPKLKDRWPIAFMCNADGDVTIIDLTGTSVTFTVQADLYYSIGLKQMVSQPGTKTVALYV